MGTQAGIDVPLEYSGAGRRRRMTLAVWEWTRDLLADPGERAVVIAYDEPDTHLDYANQRDLVELIRDQSTRDSVRVLVATHSLNLIDKVDIADVVHLQLVDGHTRVSRLLSDEHQEVNRHLAAISAAMGLRNSVLLHERVFVAVEGSTEAQALPILFRLVVGMSLQSSGIALIAGNNNRGALDVARWLASHNREVQFIIDRDSTQDRSTRSLFTPEKLRAVGIRPDQMHLLGDPGEIEDLFTDDLWARTANEAWPRRDGEDWKPTDIGELRGEGKFSNKLLALAREQSEQGPSTKTECLVELATRLTDPDEVPEQLRECFRQLVELAAGDYSVDHAPG
ncbi:MAG: AAA family ATPase [Actinobacteria bacterium]|nr:AAA family ATPase [Actinomycetota bacterium]